MLRSASALIALIAQIPYGEFPDKIVAKGGLKLENAHSMMLDTLTGSLAGYPGGLDVISEMSSKRFPNQALPHKDLFILDGEMNR